VGAVAGVSSDAGSVGLFIGRREGERPCTGAVVMRGRRPVGVERVVMGLGRLLQSTEGGSK
jgi:hypothetical protein